jgi:hypothetical protein
LQQVVDVSHLDIAYWHVPEWRIFHIAREKAYGLPAVVLAPPVAVVFNPLLADGPKGVLVACNRLQLQLLLIGLGVDAGRHQFGRFYATLAGVVYRQIRESPKGIAAILAIQPVVKFPHLRTRDRHPQIHGVAVTDFIGLVLGSGVQQ